jgi:ribosome biogenesis GTPase / thiamine phosphate phosphatase
VKALAALGWNPYFDRQVSDEERLRWVPACVVWQGREHYRLSTGDQEWHGQLAGRLRHAAGSRADLPVVGDWVLAALRSAEGSATIHRRLARRSQFSRAAAGRSTAEQIVAANVDTILLVTSFNRDFNLRRLERYLALTWESGARPVVVLNKADLCTDHERWRSDMTSVSQGVPVVVTSALRGDGLAELDEVIRTGGTTALLGSSGVGKSTLINALVGDSRQGILPIRESDDRGRHSTTARQLFCLPRGGVLIDTPGLRELQLWDAEEGLEHAFADILALAAGCRFRDCSHGDEPGCAVTAAVEQGEVPAGRLDNYHRLQREDAFLRSRHDERARVERTRQAKQITRAVRLQYKLRRR